MSLRTIIADDEPLARERVRTFLQQTPDVEIVTECTNGNEALNSIVSHEPDVVFLDVQMPGLTGFEVLQALPPGINPAIVFTTAHDRFALEAFEVNAVDYLLKPFKLARFQQAVERTRRALEARTPGASNRKLAQWLDQRAPLPPGQRRLMVKDPDRVVFVRLDDIDWIEAAGNYAVLHVGRVGHVLRETMVNLEKELPEELFFRASRSAFIHLQRIRELQPLPGGQHVVILHDGQKITMTRPLRELQARLA